MQSRAWSEDRRLVVGERDGTAVGVIENVSRPQVRRALS